MVQICIYSKLYNHDTIKYGYNLRKYVEVLYIENNKEDIWDSATINFGRF